MAITGNSQWYSLNISGGTSNTSATITGPTGSSASYQMAWDTSGGTYYVNGPPAVRRKVEAVLQKSHWDPARDAYRYLFEVEVTAEMLRDMGERAVRQMAQAKAEHHASRGIDRHVFAGDTLYLPDGCRLVVDGRGNWRVETDDAQVRYAANNNREFNPYVNAGDLLGEFIDYVRVKTGIRPRGIKDLPLGLFVNWLIIEAAERDQDPVPDDVTPIGEDRQLRGRVHPQCLLPTCRRFVPRGAAQAGFQFCDGDHAARYGRLLRRAA